MNNIELFLFSSEPAIVEEADLAGIDGFIIDWENRDDLGRQQTHSDRYRPDSNDDLARLTGQSQKPVWCRINQSGMHTENEIELALKHGADLILLPMVRQPDEVEYFLSLVSGRAQTGILVETVEACDCAAQLASLPLDRVYVGLLDLAISRDSSELFKPLTDGSVEQLRKTFHNTRFGVGGLTTVDTGKPIPCLELMAHLHRLGCDFTFLRNSFKRDIAGKNIKEELNLIRAAWAQLSNAN